MYSSEDCSSTELITYSTIWISAVLYSVYKFAIDSNKYFQNYPDDYADFSQGWGVLSRKKDTSDYEWQTIKLLIEKLYLWVILSITVSEILRKYKLIKLLPIWQISITIIFIIKELGIFPLIVIMFQPLIFTLTVKGRSKIAVWICNGLVLTLITFYKNYSAKEEFLIIFKMNEIRAYITILTIFWMNLRCVSYHLDFCNIKKPELLSFLSYCFYLPTAVCGPFIPYEDFAKAHQPFTESFLHRIRNLILNLLRFIFWMLFAEFCLHFIYVNAVTFHLEWVLTLNSWSLYGYGYAMGQFFHIKYLVIYGLATTFAKFENIPVPSLPVCIGRIHLYSDMWKYFDAGLYNFILNYIYIPLGNSRIFKNRLLRSLVCFVFVYIWHGTDDYILIWTILNYLGIVIENGAEWIYKKHLENSKILEKLGPKWFRRITCMMGSPLLAMSAISNFYFFARAEIGHIFVYHFFNDTFLANAILLGILYNCCQISTHLRLLRRKISEKPTKII